MVEKTIIFNVTKVAFNRSKYTKQAYLCRLDSHDAACYSKLYNAVRHMNCWEGRN
jgi:hypothetical protein